jgi:hypothetical protein
MAATVNGLSLSKLRAFRRDLLHLQRLRAAGDPAIGFDGTPYHIYFHPRRDG